MKKRNISLVMSFLLLFSACSRPITSIEYSNEKVLRDKWMDYFMQVVSMNII